MCSGYSTKRPLIQSERDISVAKCKSLDAQKGTMDKDVIDNETFGDLAEGDAGELPAFFTNGTSGDQEFTSLMQDLKDAALTEADADSGAGGLEGLYDVRDGLPDFFQIDLRGPGRSSGTNAEPESNKAEERSSGSQKTDVRRLGDDASSLFESLTTFGANSGSGGGGAVGHSAGEDILASLRLPPSNHQQGEQRRQRENEQEENRHRRRHGVTHGLGTDSSTFEVDESDWAHMQKEFEKMNKGFLQDYRHNEAEGEDGPLGTDDGEQAAFATMRQLSLDDLEPGFPTTSSPRESISLSQSAQSTASNTGPSLLPPGAKTLEELEAEFAAVSIGPSSGLGSTLTPSQPPVALPLQSRPKPPVATSSRDSQGTVKGSSVAVGSPMILSRQGDGFSMGRVALGGGGSSPLGRRHDLSGRAGAGSLVAGLVGDQALAGPGRGGGMTGAVGSEKGIRSHQDQGLVSVEQQDQRRGDQIQQKQKQKQHSLVGQDVLWPDPQLQQQGAFRSQGAIGTTPDNLLGVSHTPSLHAPGVVASSMGAGANPGVGGGGGGQQTGGGRTYPPPLGMGTHPPGLGTPQPFGPAPQIQGHAQGQGRQQQQQQQQPTPSTQPLAQPTPQTPHSGGFIAPRTAAGMSPFHTLPPHVQAHLLQQQAIARGRAPPQTPLAPPSATTPSSFSSVGSGGDKVPFSPSVASQQQRHQPQQPQPPQPHPRHGMPVVTGPVGAMARGPMPGMPGPPPPPPPPTMALHGQPSHFPPPRDARSSPGLPMSGGAGHGIITMAPPPQFARAPLPHPVVVSQQMLPPPGQSRSDARSPMPPIENFPRGELMTAYDTRYVIMAQMRALETPDPFNDDFYYHNAMRRKQEKQHRDMIMGAESLAREAAPHMPMPLPVWQETKEIAKKVKDEQADAVKKRIRQWESENRVLGHHARSDVHRPRALLVLSGSSGGTGVGASGEDGDTGSQDGDVMVSGGAPFETHLWRARLAIQRATNAMLAAYELRYLLHLPTTPQEKKSEVATRLREVIVDLAVSLGLERSTIMQQADGKSAPDVSALEASLDLRVLSTVLELTKGQKLLSRCLAMLPPRQRSALVPSVLALTLARAPAATLRNAPSEQVKADAIKAEEALANELKAVVQSPGALPLPILRRCVELVMTAHRGRGSLAAALGSVSRAEVLSAVLQRGGEMSEAEGGEAVSDWTNLQEEFIAMARETPQSSMISVH